MVVNYSKWDALELSDDSDIEVHPNVDKRSFIRAKQNQIHQERYHRKHEIETLKYERIINDGLLTRIDALLNSLKAHTDGTESPDELILQSIIESAGDPAEDKPPPRPDGVHAKLPEQPTYSKMMAALVDQVRKEVDGQKPEDRMGGYIKEVNGHKDKVLDLQQQLLTKLAELERLEGNKITSESIHTGFNSSHVSKSKESTTTNAPSSSPSSSSQAAQSVELLNPPKRQPLHHRDSADSGADADIEDEAPDDDSSLSVHQATALGKAFAKITPSDYRTSLQYISQHPTVIAERETDGLLIQAFDAQIAGKDDVARRCVHQALLLQYCRSLGRDGVALFFKRITTKDHQARKVFADDVNSTYARLRTRAAEMAKESAENGSGEDGAGVEQIQLHAVNPGQTISITIPSAENPEEVEARKTFDAFPPGLQRALESESLDEVNKVLGKMSVEEAEEVVEQLGQSGMLILEEGVIDTTTEEGKEAVRLIDEEARRNGQLDGEDEKKEEGEAKVHQLGEPGREVEKNAVDEVD